MEKECKTFKGGGFRLLQTDQITRSIKATVIAVLLQTRKKKNIYNTNFILFEYTSLNVIYVTTYTIEVVPIPGNIQLSLLPESH